MTVKETTTTPSAVTPLAIVALVISLLSIAVYSQYAKGTFYTSETIVSTCFILVNFVFTFYLDRKAISTGNVMIWGVLLKGFKTFLIFVVLCLFCILKVTNDVKLLAISFLLGFAVTMIFEVISLRKLTIKKQD